MNSKQAKTLRAIFTDPAPSGVAWADIEGLLVAVGCTVVEGRGSRVRFVKDGELALFHRPHPDKDAKRYQVRAARDYLERLGVRP
jgi:hypothetical protein